MTVHFSGLAVVLAGGGAAALAAGVVLLAASFGHSDRGLTAGALLAWLGGIALVLGVAGQVFLWISGALR